jgi:hypothetical protein
VIELFDKWMCGIPLQPPGIDLAAAMMLRVLRALRVGFQRRVYSPVLTTHENMDVGGA